MESRQWQESVFIDGQFGRPAAGGTLPVRDKASGEIFATCGQAGPDDVGAAVAAARQAQPLWAERTYAERASILRAAAAALERQAGDFRELIMRETGCIGGKADYEIGAAASQLIEAAGLASRATGEVLPTTDGPFFRPTVVIDVPTDSRLWTEEIFAPIAPITVVDDPDEAVALANDTKYGLVDAVLTGDAQAGLQLARRLRAGMVHVNDATPQDEALAPFGGIGQSGLGGRSGGDANIEEFTERRWLTVNPGPAHYPY